MEERIKTKKNHGCYVNRRPGTYHTKPCTLTFDDGDTLRFDSMKELAEAIHGTYSGLWVAMKKKENTRATR